MMMKKILAFFALMMLLTGTLVAQGTKTIKEKQISTLTVYEHFLEDGEKEPVVEAIEMRVNTRSGCLTAMVCAIIPPIDAPQT